MGANVVVVEANQGGDMAISVCQSAERVSRETRTDMPPLAYEKVHASVGKQARAQPVSQKAEQGKARFVGSFPKLEDELCDWVPGQGKASPNRLDAYVWACTKLLTPAKKRRPAGAWGRGL